MVYIYTDEWKDKAKMTEGQIEWLFYHESGFESWMAEKGLPEVDRESLHEQIFHGKNPHLAYFFYLYLMQDNIGSDENKIQFVVEKFLGIENDYDKPKKGEIMLIMGQRGWGKTAFAYLLCDILNKRFKQEIWWYGPPCILPPFVSGSTLNIEKIPPNTIILFDEAGVQAYSRLSMSKQQIESTQKIPLIRQHDKSFIVITQDEQLMDRNWLLQASSLVFLSKMFIPVRKRRLVINDYLTYFMPYQKSHHEVLYFDNSCILTFKSRLPHWWGDKYSKPYAPFRSDAEMYRFILKIMEDLYQIKGIDKSTNYNEVAMNLSLRGRKLSDYEFEFIRRICDSAGIKKLQSYSDDRLIELLSHGYYDTTLNDLADKKNNKARYNFQMPEMMRLEWERDFEKNPELYMASLINANPILLEDAKYRMKKGNIITSFSGPTGSGKSNSGFSFSGVIMQIFHKRKLKDSDWKHLLELICFEDDQVIESISKATAGSIITRDEQPKSFGPGSGASYEKIKSYEETMRKKQISFVFNSPALHPHVNHFMFKTFGEDYDAGVFRLMMYTSSGMPIGYVTLKYPPQWFIEEYKKKNLAWLELRQKNKSSSSVSIEKRIDELECDEVFLALDTKREKESYIRNKYNMTTNQSWDVFDMFNARQKAKELNIQPRKQDIS